MTLSDTNKYMDVVVDGMSVPVVVEEWLADSNAVEEKVRAARIAFVLPDDESVDESEFEDYDKLGDVEDEEVPAEKNLKADDGDNLDEEPDE